MDRINRINLVLLYGPPGIGKSTFKEKLNQHISTLASREQQKHIVCVSISYDDIIDKNIESYLINNSNDENESETDSLAAINKPNWKQGRQLITKLISNLIDHLTDQTDFTQIDFCNSSYLVRIYENFKNCMDRQLNNLTRSTELKYVILLDDLFYYESMRVVLYRLALTKSCGYFVYYFKAIDLTLLLERNQTRNSNQKLDDSIIENIFAKIEPPKEWEKEFSHCELVTREPKETNLFKSFETILNGLSQFSLHLEQIKQNEAASLDLARLSYEANKNLIHASDLILRKLIASKLNVSNEKHLLAKKLNKLKQDVLDDLRVGRSELSFKLSNLYHLNDKQQIENELRSKIDSIM